MNNISNIDNISKKYMYDPDFQTEMKTILIGDAIGCEKIYVNIDYIKPGSESVKYHSHSKQEEFYLIMSGTGILRIDGEEILIKVGDVISTPAGKDIGHQFINNSSEILQILDVGTREKDDIISYPEENVIYVKNKNLVFNIKDNIKNWSSEPNQ
ncbi:MAG: mannose-6-phosphate isomerase [Firmicutes bacterium HGW-Firmicutes-7]|nr:MAG: mannose-6-phosphate isomerase [Firmicutes bacterium HGW-Firmicutes-7]